MEEQPKKRNNTKTFVIRSKYITVRTHRYGTLRLNALSLRGAEFAEGLIDAGVLSREFVVQVIHQHLNSPELSVDELRATPDKLLARVATIWAEHQDGLGKKLPKGVPTFDAFHSVAREALAEHRQRVVDSFRELGQSMSKIALPTMELPSLSSILGNIELDTSVVQHIIGQSGMLEMMRSGFNSFAADLLEGIEQPLLFKSLDSLGSITSTLNSLSFQSLIGNITGSAEGFAGVLQQVSQSIQEIMSSFRPTFEFGNLFDAFPQPLELIRQWDEAEQAEIALEACGYGFATHLWETTFVLVFAKANPKVRAASITNRLLAVTRSSEFSSTLISAVQNSPTLKRRQRVISRALEAHIRRDYIVSVPLLLSQLEGVVGDMLRLKGQVSLRDGKMYARGLEGAIKLGRDGKPVELKGLHPLIKHADWESHPVLDRLADLLTTQLIGDRNKILHGRRVDYSSAKLSMQALLSLLVLVRETEAFEASRIAPSA